MGQNVADYAGNADHDYRPELEALDPGCLRLAPDTYVTDESNLFRCLSADRSLHPYATLLLEDCLTLEVHILPMAELRAASLRIVKSARA